MKHCSSVSRVLEPLNLIELDMEFGKKKLIPLPLPQFHNVRILCATKWSRD